MVSLNEAMNHEPNFLAQFYAVTSLRDECSVHQEALRLGGCKDGPMGFPD